MNEEEADSYKPKIVIVDDDNAIVEEFEGLE
jgi:aspartate 1-decarboxylase